MWFFQYEFFLQKSHLGVIAGLWTKKLWGFSKDSDSIGKTGILETCHVQALVPSVTRSLAKLNEQNHVGKNGCRIAWGIMTRWWQFKYFYFFIPIIWGRWTHFDTYISDGLVRQPPTRWWVSWVSMDSLKPKTVDKNWDCNVGLREAPKTAVFFAVFLRSLFGPRIFFQYHRSPIWRLFGIHRFRPHFFVPWLRHGAMWYTMDFARLCHTPWRETHELRTRLVGGFKYLLCSSLPGEMMQFD